MSKLVELPVGSPPIDFGGRSDRIASVKGPTLWVGCEHRTRFGEVLDALASAHKAVLIYRRTGNLRAVQLLLGHSKIESTVCYLGIEVDDAIEIDAADVRQRNPTLYPSLSWTEKSGRTTLRLWAAERT